MAGHVGDTVTFGLSMAGPPTTVDVNGVPATVTQMGVLMAGDWFSFPVPAGASTGEIHITTLGVTIDAGTFTVQ